MTLKEAAAAAQMLTDPYAGLMRLAPRNDDPENVVRFLSKPGQWPWMGLPNCLSGFRHPDHPNRRATSWECSPRGVTKSASPGNSELIAATYLVTFRYAP